MNVIVKVNIVSALRWGVASVRITLLSVVHPICHSLHVKVNIVCGFVIIFVKCLK